MLVSYLRNDESIMFFRTFQMSTLWHHTYLVSLSENRCEFTIRGSKTFQHAKPEYKPLPIPHTRTHTPSFRHPCPTPNPSPNPIRHRPLLCTWLLESFVLELLNLNFYFFFFISSILFLFFFQIVETELMYLWFVSFASMARTTELLLQVK